MIGKGSKIVYKIDKNNKCCEDTKSLLVLFPEYTESDLDKLVSIARRFKNLKKFILCYGKFLPECNLSFHKDELLNIKSLHIMGDGTHLSKIVISDLQNLEDVDFDIVNNENLTGQFINLPGLNGFKIVYADKFADVEIKN